MAFKLRKSEILFLLVGKNPLPNYVAAKLLANRLEGFGKSIIWLIYSEDTEKYAEKLKDVLGKDDFEVYSDKVNPWDFSSIKKVVDKGVDLIKQLAENNPHATFSVGLNYTGGTKAMSVHAYRAMKNLENDDFTVNYSYLDSKNKMMRFDVEDGSPNVPVELSNPSKPEFEQVKISLDDLLALHDWGKLSRPTDNPITRLRFDPIDLDLSNLLNFNGDMFEDFVFKQVLELKDVSKLDSIGTNLEICVPNEPGIPFFELDVAAIRGYQLFVISCTLEGRNHQMGKELRKSKLFEVVHRARQLGGAEAQICLVSLADTDRKKLLEKQLKDDHIRVFGKDDLSNLKSKLQRWFEGR